jgi:DNA-binding MarR family transcriptional regulator
MPDTNPPLRSLGFAIHDVARLLKRRFDERAQKSGLTRAQWHVLAPLKHYEGINQSGLADLLDLEPITLSRHIDRLEAAGWVERRPDPADRRAHRLYLGHRVPPLLAEMRELAAQVYSEALVGIDPGEADRLVDMLMTIRANLCRRGEGEGPAAARELELNEGMSR